MGGRYGMSFTKKLIEDGSYDEAVAEATKEIAGGNSGPEIHAERAVAFELLERWSDAVDDFERALLLDRDERVLELDLVDDAYFSALLAAAKDDATRSIDAGCARLDRYPVTLPAGAHLLEVVEWKQRLRGELVSTLDKTVEVEV